MKQSIYLHRQIVDVLTCYGTLEDTINRILQEAANGEFDIMHKPPCPGREQAGRYDIEILEPNYLELLSTYSPFSSKISLRRLIYWFVDNELYEELGWEPIKEFQDRNLKMLQNKLSKGLNELEKAKRYAFSKTVDTLEEICNSIKILQEYLKNG